MLCLWPQLHREPGPFVWSGGSVPEFGQSGGQGLSERRAKDAKRKTFNENGVKTTLKVA
jgi:hypothetical protein